MGAMSRNKGKRGEREVAALISELLGITASRRVRQHGGDSDILGVPGWCIEVKRCERATPADIRRWWEQAVAQMLRDGDSDVLNPALFYRQSRRDWRVLWPLSAAITVPFGVMWPAHDYAVESTPEAWAAVVREMAP